MKKDLAGKILAKTKTDYNRIAGHFSSTRKRISVDLEYLAGFAEKGEKVLDAGCGNGRFSEVLPKCEYVGLDESPLLLDQAKRKYPRQKFVEGSFLQIPFPDFSFDKVFCLAALHHIPSKALRQKVFAEFFRVLKPNGRAIISVWNVWRMERARRILLRNMFLKLIGRSELDFRDLMLPWRNGTGEVTAERYLHAFCLSELKKFAKNAGFAIIKSGKLKRSASNYNLYIVAKRNF